MFRNIIASFADAKKISNELARISAILLQAFYVSIHPYRGNPLQIVFVFCSDIQQRTLVMACRLRHVCSRMFTFVMRALTGGLPLKICGEFANSSVKVRCISFIRVLERNIQHYYLTNLYKLAKK